MSSSAHSPSPRSEAQRTARGRVLLVEDNPEAALFATLVLGERGQFEVTHTADPAAALVLAASAPWDLVLTDMDLPVMSGLELLAALRELAPHIPVLLVTASPRGTLPTAAGAPGPCASAGGRPDGLLVKPVPAERLLSAAIRLADGGRAN